MGAAIGLRKLLAPKAVIKCLNKQRQKLRIMDVRVLSHDVKLFRLSLGSKDTVLGLPTGKHLILYAPSPEKSLTSGKWNGKPDIDKGKTEIDRRYTPVTGDETPGYVDLVIKIYRPGKVVMPDGKEMMWEDGGKMSRFLDDKKPGDYIDLKGPVGLNEYLGRGMFKAGSSGTREVSHVGMIAGGTGITPMLQVATAALRDREDATRFSLIYANKTEEDILCRDLLDEAARGSGGRFTVHYTLDFPPAGWSHRTGFVTSEMIRECLPAPGDDCLVLLCGPPPMIDFACKPNLEKLGHAKSSVVCF